MACSGRWVVSVCDPNPNPVLNPNSDPSSDATDEVPPAAMFFGRAQLGRRNAAGPLFHSDQEAHELREHRREVQAAESRAQAAAAADDDSSVEDNSDEDAMSADEETAADERDVSDNVNLPSASSLAPIPDPNPSPNANSNPNPHPYLHLPNEVPMAAMFFGRSQLGRRNAPGPLTRSEQ